MPKTASPTPKETPAPSSTPQKNSPRFNLLGVTGIALTTFMFGIYVGSSFIGSTSPPQAPAGMAGLPTDHPPVDPNNPVPAGPLPASTGGTPQAGGAPAEEGHGSHEPGMDIKFDDPAIRAKIESTSDFQGLVRIGNEQFDLGHPLLAIAAYEKALKINAFDPNVQTDLGVMYRATHRHEDALNAFRKAVDMDPKHAQSRYNLGLVLLSDEKDTAGAIAAWEDYLKVAPNGPKSADVKRQIAELKKKPG